MYDLTFKHDSSRYNNREIGQFVKVKLSYFFVHLMPGMGGGTFISSYFFGSILNVNCMHNLTFHGFNWKINKVGQG